MRISEKREGYGGETTKKKDTNESHEENGKASYTMGDKPRVNIVDDSIQGIPHKIPNQYNKAVKKNPNIFSHRHEL